MHSKLLGQVSFDDQLLRQDIDKIFRFGDVKEEYSEYRFGSWKNFVLWNGTGRRQDTLFRGMQGGDIQTEFGRQLEHINSVIEENFHTERLKMVRINLLKDAILIPHRDYVEFKSDSNRLARLHIPIKTNPQSLHSENESVFHMRLGEIWYLDVTCVHSACNPTEDPRLSIVLDFALDGGPLESLFKSRQIYRPDLAPMIIEREPLDEEFVNAITNLKHVINASNYKDIVQFLSRIHFYKDVSSCFFFDWLIEMCRGHQDKSLLEKSIRFKSYLVDQRELSERFFL
jgi:hypothetical protein